MLGERSSRCPRAAWGRRGRGTKLLGLPGAAASRAAWTTRFGLGVALGLVLALSVSAAASRSARAHDIDIPVHDLELGVERVEKTLLHYQSRPVLAAPSDRDERDRRVALGAAEIDFALGETARALRTLLGQLEEPAFQQQPEYVPALLLASEILERSGDDFGAMAYARRALEVGGEPEQMAEAGARWFSLARRWQRLEPREEVFELWRARGGARAASGDVSASVMYEAAFALRARGDRAEAQQLLSNVPSGSPHGSRAAYLAGVLYVEAGDLANAERWFAAVMAWPIPSRLEADQAGARGYAIEREVRALAALSAARLRYERGDLEAALEAYGRVPEGSDQFAEACWEQAYLTLELERPRAALDHLKCVDDLGAGGKRRIDARLFAASLDAHLGRYAESLRRYDDLRVQFGREHALVQEALSGVDDPSAFLFEAMERTAADEDPVTSPGPPTLFADAWTPEVDAAYRVTSGLQHTGDDVRALATTLREYRARLTSIDAFPEVKFRRENLERLLVEVDHLIGHAGELVLTSRASREWADVGGHPSERARIEALLGRLRSTRAGAQAELTGLTRRAELRLSGALAELDAVSREVAAIRGAMQQISARAEPIADAVAQDALEAVRDDLADAAMRAEVGVLDTFWIRKQERTRAIEERLERKKETQRQLDEALRSSRER